MKQTRNFDFNGYQHTRVMPLSVRLIKYYLMLAASASVIVIARLIES
ncbi:MAG: hypothetical protein K1X47_00055 [Cyclobacteriaceae bacterium]|nr:hypothetical protein [Cyclobacteriaceae bacterium]